MELKSSLLKSAYENRRIKLSKIYDLCLEESEHFEFIDHLKKHHIKIIDDIYDESINDDNSENILGIYISEIRNYPLLSLDEEKELIKRYKSGDNTVRDKIINSNLRYVIYVANYYKRKATASFDYLDMIQEGNVGLIKALDKYELDRGAKFSEYAKWWISAYINKAIYYQGMKIRLPISMLKKLKIILEYKERFIKNTGFEPKYSDYIEDLKVSKDDVDIIKLLSIKVISLETVVDDKESTIIKDFIQSEDDYVEVVLDKIYCEEIIKTAKRILSDKQYKVLLKYFGTGTEKNDFDEGKTLKTISEEMNITKERVRQLKLKALKKIKKEYNNY